MFKNVNTALILKKSHVAPHLLWSGVSQDVFCHSYGLWCDVRGADLPQEPKNEMWAQAAAAQLHIQDQDQDRQLGSVSAQPDRWAESSSERRWFKQLASTWQTTRAHTQTHAHTHRQTHRKRQGGESFSFSNSGSFFYTNTVLIILTATQ